MNTCKRCGKPSQHLGAISGTCHDCQNNAVALLEESLGMQRGTLGRVDRDLSVRYPKRTKLRMAKADTRRRKS